MRGRAARGYRRTPRVLALEEEFGEELPAIIAGFAADGVSKTTAAGALGYEGSTFWVLLRSLESVGHRFAWRDPYDRQAPPYVHTEARASASAAALQLARQGSAAYWATRRKATAELVQQAVTLRADRLSWRTIAKRLGVDPTTLSRARRTYGLPPAQ